MQYLKRNSIIYILMLFLLIPFQNIEAKEKKTEFAFEKNDVQDLSSMDSYLEKIIKLANLIVNVGLIWQLINVYSKVRKGQGAWGAVWGWLTAIIAWNIFIYGIVPMLFHITFAPVSY